MADQVRSIATAEEIGRTVNRASRISDETARAMGESSAAVDNLAGQAKTLHGPILDMQREGAAKAPST